MGAWAFSWWAGFASGVVCTILWYSGRYAKLARRVEEAEAKVDRFTGGER